MGIPLIVNHTQIVELTVFNVFNTAARLACRIGARADGNAHFMTCIDDFVHKGLRPVLDAEVSLEVELCDMLRVRIVVHGRDAEREVPYCFRVYVVDCYRKHFVAVLDRAVLVVGGRAVGFAVYRHGFFTVCELDARNVGEFSFLIFIVLFHCVVRKIVVELNRGIPVLQHLGDRLGNFVRVNGVYRLLLRPLLQIRGVVYERRGKLALLLVPRYVTLVVEEHLDVGGEGLVYVALFVGERSILVSVEGIRIVAFKLLLEKLNRLVEIFDNVFRRFVRSIVIFEISAHSRLVERGVLVENFFRRGHKRVYSRLRFELVFFHKVVLLGFVGFLRAVFFKSDYVGRIHRARTGVGGVEIDVHIEQHVLNREGRTVREFDVIL